ncbi:outer membrane receptor protein [Desulforapulum autotrophicum HRM2]|uniref:Outer membrane receptor protein n=1 Tax=Desulforapulum autotrophicum (strain ATCC 43914 / DSM 3382 / VKM B-1955 / HRM2) TaxID=177437 RepID=C0QHE4_DESAH|nr:TonB-dependent receptor plug domain-containing protein [Desulforapulum autotrophicum]ACN17803.1 outer membrane receptor protein [Desulforapulum autotrophicum HRM2]
MKKTFILTIFLMLLMAGTALSEENKISDKSSDNPSDNAFVMDEIRVTAQNVKLSPNKTEVFMDDYNIAGQPTNVLDILKDRAIIDFRGESDLVPESDSIQMRGFDTRQFLVSVDGLVIQKTGGWWGDHYVDFGMIPLSLVDSIEILSGPHSALYDGKSFGGVLNLKTREPTFFETPQLEGSISTSFRSYGTQSQKVDLNGGKGGLNLGFSYEKYHTDGYLRNNEADMATVTGRLGYKLPSGGYIRLTGTYSDLEREIPCANDPSRKDYDNNYPVVKAKDVSPRWLNPDDDSRRDYEGHSLRFDFVQPSAMGKWSLGTYYTDESQAFHRDGFDYSEYATNYVSYGALVKNEFNISDNHQITMGMDTAHLYQKYSEKIVETWAGYLQDKWQIIPCLSWTAGLRYENIDIWWDNWWEPSTTYPDGAFKDPSHSSTHVRRNYDQLAPKSFLTYEMDELAPWLRDTSVSLGISKIWTPRDYCEVCSWGSGVEIDPTHGIGYDVVFTRRLWRNISLNIDVSHYEFQDYGIWANAATDYFKQAIWGRRMVELEDVHKEGVDVELNGNILDNLYFYLSYSFNEWKDKGPHNGGPEEWADQDLGDRAKHRLNAGLQYNLFENTLLLLDYKFQDKQVQQVISMVDDDPSDLYVNEVSIDSYHVFDFAVEQQLFHDWYHLKKGTLKLYVNNLFDETYSNSQGYPMTDRTFGATLGLNF